MGRACGTCLHRLVGAADEPCKECDGNEWKPKGGMPLTRNTNAVYCMSCRYGPKLVDCSCPYGCSMGDKFQSKEGQKARREEPQMNTYSYEVLVAEKQDKDGKVVRAKKLIDHAERLLERPTRESILVGLAAKFSTFKGAEKIESFESEVVVNIRPFCG